MRAGEETEMMRGAVWACALPMVLGVVGLLFFLLAPNVEARSFRFMGLPIAACFMFGTPMVACFLYTLSFVVWDAGLNGGNTRIYVDAFLIPGLINLFLWAVLTVPFSLLCATIFWRVTNFQQNISDF